MLIEILLVGAVSGFIQGLSGFAFGLVATSMWAWMMEPQRVVPLVVMGSFVGQCVSILSVRHEIRFARVRPFIVGGVIGILMGAALLHALNANSFRAIFGIFLVVYSSVMLLMKQLPKIQKVAWGADSVIGWISGALSGACGMGGPPITLWCSLRGWSTISQRATFQAFFITMQMLLLLVYAWQGIIDKPLLISFAWLVPVIMLTSWSGSRVGRHFGDVQFQKIVFGLLLLSGIVMLLPAISSLAGRLASF
ncbi:sulfite exporter TauE/SafE family protein [Parapusillimonas granuli]|uniref:Probable membrane transporter protein n=1 Tax=Parapusillimonas granuli TaxID=380911 RepID=A0A853G3R9_9BURK|nr:sulfite exporter TauE/SafE family protein [Parapusillimonas granuli]MBB5214424.1 hypothetical protein [Parapusillimonas granuli]NYT49166.1 sulfite exporter TauE/SafE family protein [Parapusillimonas granuli]